MSDATLQVTLPTEVAIDLLGAAARLTETLTTAADDAAQDGEADAAVTLGHDADEAGTLVTAAAALLRDQLPPEQLAELRRRT